MAKAAICVEHGLKAVKLVNWCMSHHKAVKSADGGGFVENARLANMNRDYGYLGRHHIYITLVWSTSGPHIASAQIVPFLPSDSDVAKPRWYPSS